MAMDMTLFMAGFSVMMETLTIWYLCELLLARKPDFRHTIGRWLLAVMGISLGNTLLMPNPYLLLVGNIIILSLVPLVLYEGNILLKFFTICMFFAIAIGMERAAKYLLAFLYGSVEEVFLNPFNRMTGTVMAKFLSLFLVRMLAVFQKVSQHMMSAKLMLMLVVFPLASILCMIQLMDTGYLNGHPQAYFRIFLTVCVLILANVVTFYAFENLAQYEFDKRKLALMQSQYNQQVQLYKRLSEEKQLTNQMRHDLKNTLLALAGYLQEGRAQDALSYIHDMQIHLQTVRVETTGILALDVVIAEKERLAKQSNSVLKVSVFIAMAIKVQEMDLAVLLANALDNAIEASVDIDGAKIQMDMRCSGMKIDIIITNPVIREVPIKNNFIATTKEDKEIHGIGLSSMQRILDRYNEYMTFYVRDKIFTLDMELDNDEPMVFEPNR